MKKHLLTILLLIILFESSKAQSKQVESSAYNLVLKNLLSHSVTEISVKEYASNKNGQTLLLDSREKSEYNISHLQKSIWVGYKNLDLSYLDNLHKNKPIIVYCSVGYRSEKVAEKIIKKGFTNVKNLYGGIFEWKNQNNEVFNQNGKTDEVHAFSKTWGIWLNKGKKIYK